MREIPEKYSPIFTTDWNTGNNSKLSSLERADIHILFLDYLKWDMKNKILEKDLKGEGGFSDFNEEEIQGFIQF